MRILCIVLILSSVFVCMASDACTEKEMKAKIILELQDVTTDVAAWLNSNIDMKQSIKTYSANLRLGKNAAKNKPSVLNKTSLKYDRDMAKIVRNLAKRLKGKTMKDIEDIFAEPHTTGILEQGWIDINDKMKTKFVGNKYYAYDFFMGDTIKFIFENEVCVEVIETDEYTGMQ